jgi:hypothetical protein
MDSSNTLTEGTCSTGIALARGLNSVVARVSWLGASLFQRIEVRSPCVEEVDPLRSLTEAEGRVCLTMDEGKEEDDGSEEGREEQV